MFRPKIALFPKRRTKKLEALSPESGAIGGDVKKTPFTFHYTTLLGPKHTQVTGRTQPGLRNLVAI